MAVGVAVVVVVTGSAAGAAVTLSTPSSASQPAASTRSAGPHVPTQRPLLAVVGASFSAGVGAGRPDQAWPQDLARITLSQK